MRRNISFLLAGAILGGAAAVFATPVSGRRMRRVLRRKIDTCSSRITEATRNLRDTGDQILRQGKQTVRSAGRVFQRSPLRAVAR